MQTELLDLVKLWTSILSFVFLSFESRYRKPYLDTDLSEGKYLGTRGCVQMKPFYKDKLYSTSVLKKTFVIDAVSILRQSHVVGCLAPFDVSLFALHCWNSAVRHTL